MTESSILDHYDDISLCECLGCNCHTKIIKKSEFIGSYCKMELEQLKVLEEHG